MLRGSVQAIAVPVNKKRCRFSETSLACRDSQWQFLPCFFFVVVFFFPAVCVDQKILYTALGHADQYV